MRKRREDEDLALQEEDDRVERENLAEEERLRQEVSRPRYFGAGLGA